MLLYNLFSPVINVSIHPHSPALLFPAFKAESNQYHKRNRSFITAGFLQLRLEISLIKAPRGRFELPRDCSQRLSRPPPFRTRLSRQKNRKADNTAFFFIHYVFRNKKYMISEEHQRPRAICSAFFEIIISSTRIKIIAVSEAL